MMLSVEIKLINESDLFDSEWYLSTYPDALHTGLSPAFHYLKYGWLIGRDPGPKFSTAKYLKDYSDVKKAGVNPLVHWEKVGKYEDRVFKRSDATLVVKRQSVEAFGMGKALKSTPLLSIVMPVYNVGPYLDACLLSVRYQSYSNFELIVVNDASSDNGLEIIKMHMAVDDRIKLINLEDNTLGGAGIPSNFGLELAQGEYIGFVDSDDWVEKNAFEKLIQAAEAHDADLAIGSFKTFDESERAHLGPYDSHIFDELPNETPFTAEEIPEVFRLSPVPWRKLYRRNYLEKNKIKYPEGDYFYEDNPLHWFSLSSHAKIVKVDTVISNHRMARVGQTMDAATYKLGALCNHINTIGQFFTVHLSMPADQSIADEFFDYCYRTCWISQRQDRHDVKSIIGKRLANIVERYSRIWPPLSKRANFENRFKELSLGYPDYDLTIVIPMHDCEDFISSTLDNVLDIENISFNVLIIDDGSTDASVEIAKKYSEKHPNIHVFEQPNKGAGRARNSIIPLCTGAYTYFLDADDAIDSDALSESVHYAKQENHDLLFFPYVIDNYDQGSTRDMFEKDKIVWDGLEGLKTQEDRRHAAAKLINYPWVRLIKTELLHDQNIFFGATVVHNDIPYHWATVIKASNIGFRNKAVCWHKKFDNRDQITNISDSRRLQAFGALNDTLHMLNNHENGESLMPVWREFSINLIDWIKKRVPDSLADDYHVKKQNYLRSLKA